MASQTIVVTNHDPAYLETIQTILEDEGYALVICLADADVAAIARARPALILIDVPFTAAEAGWALLDRITLHRELQTVAVIICSTDPRLLQAKGAWLARQGITFLEKPFSIDDLLHAVAARIGPPRGAPPA